jgi:hypothetical protein
MRLSKFFIFKKLKEFPNFCKKKQKKSNKMITRAFIKYPTAKCVSKVVLGRKFGS